MKHAITILQNAILRHTDEIKKLEEKTLMETLETMFTNDEIKNHKKCIKELQRAITILIKE